MIVPEVTAPPEILARLARRVAVAAAPPELTMMNDGAPEAAAEHLIAHLRARTAGLALR